MKRSTTKLWEKTLVAIREIKKITLESQVLIFHRLVMAERERLTGKKREGDDTGNSECFPHKRGGEPR